MAVKNQALDKRTAATLMRRLTMVELRALAAVKVAGTLSAAADAMGVTQPTLSQHIREIESKLEVRLFDRHRRGVDPTPAGSVMLRLATALQADLAQAAEELAIAVRADLRPLRIGSMPVATGGLLAQALGQFASAESNVTPSVLIEGPRDDLIEQLRHGRIDLFVGRLPMETATTDLVSELLFLDTAAVIASPHHALAARRRVEPQQLLQYRWVVPGEDTTFYQQVSQTLRSAGCAMPQGMVQSYSMHAMPAIVASSDLLGFLPTSLFAAGSMGGKLRRVQVELPWTPAPIGALLRPVATQDERLQPLLRKLRAVAGSARLAVAGT